MLAEKAKVDAVNKSDRLKELEVVVEKQRQQLHEWNMKVEHERDEWRGKEEKEEQTQAEIRKSYSGPVRFANALDCFPLR